MTCHHLTHRNCAIAQQRKLRLTLGYIVAFSALSISLAIADRTTHGIVFPCPNHCEPIKASKVYAIDLSAYPTVTPTPTPTQKPITKTDIVAYISSKWEKHGTDQIVKAIDCFYSESGLRSDAYNFNKNGTEDRGIAQINSVHKMKPEDALDPFKNIDKAYEIYKSRGNNFSAWYGSRCK